MIFRAREEFNSEIFFVQSKHLPIRGSVEALSIGEIRLSLRQSLANIGFGFLSRDPKLQLLIYALEVVLRPSSKEKQKNRSQKPRKSSSGRGKWMALANVARFLSVSVSDLAPKSIHWGLGRCSLSCHGKHYEPE